jgi:aldehyde dehydrogenase (NAD+)
MPSLALPQRPELLFIGGEWVAPLDGRLIEVVAPSSGERLAHAALAGPADVAAAVAAARNAFDRGVWPQTPWGERASMLLRLAAALEERESAIQRLLAAEVGTPVAALPQVEMCVQLLRDLARRAAGVPWVESRSSVEGRYELRRTPVGVVVAIVPWNVPLFLGMAKLAPALLAGCTVVLKPAEETPLHASLLAELLTEVGVPPGVVSVVPADRETSELLVRAPRVDKVSFTGSTAAGRRIGAICAESVKRCGLELGGKSAAVILPDADLEAVVAELAPATMINSGQMCANQTRVLVPAARAAEATEALAERIGSFTVGDPLDPGTEIGPLISERQRQRVEFYVELGRAEGARLVLGGGRPVGYDQGTFVEPTVFAGVDNGMRIAREEIFGPVVAVIPYRDEEEAVQIANDSPYGLAGSVWGSDPERANALARRIRAGIVGVNSLLLDVAVPFGGFKESGIGRECGREGLEQFFELQAIETAA